MVREFGEWGLGNVGSWPQIWRQERVGLLQSVEEGSAEVFSGTGLTHTAGVDIIDTGEHKNLLGHLGGNTTSSSRSGHKSDGTRSALSLTFDGDGMDITDLRAPVTSSDWDKVHLGINQGTLDSNLHFLGDLDSETDVTSHHQSRRQP